MDCHQTRDVLDEYRRGALPADAARSVEAHLAGCRACRGLREADEALAALIRALPRTPAPPSLRREIQAAAGRRPGPAGWLGRPWVAAALAAVLVAAVLSPWLGGRRAPAPDALDILIASGVDEYKGIQLQVRAFGGEVADPAAAFAVVRSLTEIQLPLAWAGDKDFRLVTARPTVIANRRAATAVLAADGRSVATCFLLRGTDLPMPGERRVQIDQYKPYMREVDGLYVIYWKQGDLAYLIVSDLDDAASRQLFLRMRRAL